MMCEEQRRETTSDRVVNDVDDECRKSLTMIIPKLRIKIKLPKMSCDDDKHRIRNFVADADDDVDKEYACLLCGKGFRSRKALGGHMRVHAHQRPNDVASSDLEAADEDGDKDVIRCPICERDFPSNKALFGHMRCHPERSWRGIQPPTHPVYNTSSSSTVSDVNQPSTDGDNDDVVNGEKQGVVDLEKDLLSFKWGAKSIRGRDAITTKSFYSSSSAPIQSAAASGLFRDSKKSMEDVEPEEVDGVQSLILLSLGNNGRKLQNSKIQNDQFTTLRRPDVLKVRDNANYMMMNKNLKFNADQSQTIRGTKRKSYSDLFPSEDESNFIMKQMHKVRKYSIVDNDFKFMLQPQYSYSPAAATTATVEERYKCTTCYKCFSSHQALGGHKSSHNKLRNNNYTSPTTIISHNNVVTDPPHQCNICFKVFSSGQALGGHKSQHCTAAISKTHLHPPLPVKSSTDQPLDPEGVSVLKGFDLNEPPPIEVEEDCH